MEFRKITFDNYEECRKLNPGKENQDFVASNTNSLAAAYVALESNACSPMPFGIYSEDVMVGFIMMSYIREDQDKDLNNNIYDIWRFMIDEKHQGKGYGKKAMIKAVDFLKTKPKGPAKSCFLSYLPGNKKAENLYRSIGFTPTGKVEDGEILMELKI